MNLDLTAAIEAAARDRYEVTEHTFCWPDLAEVSKGVWRSDVEMVVIAAAPLIAAQVAEQIVTLLESLAGGYAGSDPRSLGIGYDDVLLDAVRRVREAAR